MKRYARKAHLKNVLVFYDQPQVVHLKGDRGFDLVAVAVPTEDVNRMDFFAVEVGERTYSDYLLGHSDLRYLFKTASRNRFYFFDWLASENGLTFKLRSATANEIKSADIYPDAGFFSSSHTDDVAPESDDGAQLGFSADAKYQFKIDGRWEASDFSRFYARIDELYAFSAINERIGSGISLNPEDKRFLKGAISSRTWERGGSYTAFYRELREHPDDTHPLRVSKIAYASPGEIVVAGEKAALKEVAGLLKLYSDEMESFESSYKILHGTLARERLLSSSQGSEELTKAMLAMITRYAAKLYRLLRVENKYSIYLICDRDPIIFSKLALSLHRRLRDLSKFYEQSRVSAGGFI